MARQMLYAPIAVAAVATVPGIIARLAGIHIDPPLLVLVAGGAIMGAAFLLLWACDAAQSDISQALALAVVALIAVLPEYSVDMYFTWKAGQFPQSQYAHYAIANMTGANRLLIGVAWPVIVAIVWAKFRRPVCIEKERRTELLFLAIATAYAFFITIKGSLAWYDGVVLIALYVIYIAIASKRPCAESEIEGPAHVIIRLPKTKRRLATLVMFLFAAGAIVLNAEPFCEALIGTGRVFKINEFLLVQWLAPIASEMPEFVVAIMFAVRGQAGLALGSLLSAKLNQWTLLVGMIPGVFAVSHGSLAHSIPMNTIQMDEILLTAAQSLLAVVILASLRLTMGQAILLFALFIGQLMGPTIVNYLPDGMLLGFCGKEVHRLFTAFYLVSAATVFLSNPQWMKGLWQGRKVFMDTPAEQLENGEAKP